MLREGFSEERQLSRDVSVKKLACEDLGGRSLKKSNKS